MANKNFSFVKCKFCGRYHWVRKGGAKACIRSIVLDNPSAHYIAVTKSGKKVVQSPVYEEIDKFLEKEAKKQTEKAFA